MTKEQALKALLGLAASLKQPKGWAGYAGDPEAAHSAADEILLDLIDDEEVRAAYESIEPKWYA